MFSKEHSEIRFFMSEQLGGLHALTKLFCDKAGLPYDCDVQCAHSGYPGFLVTDDQDKKFFTAYLILVHKNILGDIPSVEGFTEVFPS